MAVTIKDLVKATGLGSATISAYLNGVAVRPYNKKKIEDAVRELGYIRNDYARGLKMHSSKTIGVLIPELSNIFATTIITEMEEVLRDKGYGIIVCDCRTNIELEQNALKFLLSKMVDGLIVMPITTDMSALKIATDNNIPTVVIDRLTDCTSVSHVIINNQEISQRAVEKLLAKNCNNIAIVTGDMSVYTAKERRLGYQNALERANRYNPKYIFDGHLSTLGGYTAVKNIITNYPEIDGIFVTNYEMTVGAMMAISEDGKKIGEDYAFVGFDNVEMSKMFSPKIETVIQPLMQIGQVAAQLLLDMIAKTPPENVVLEAKLNSEI